MESGEGRSNLEKKPCLRQTQWQRGTERNCRMSQFEGTFRTSESYHLFSFPDRETGIVLYRIHRLTFKNKVQRGKETDKMSHSHSGSDLGPELTYFNPSLGALHIPHEGKHSSPLGQGGARVWVGVSLWNRGFSLFHKSCVPAEL